RLLLLDRDEVALSRLAQALPSWSDCSSNLAADLALPETVPLAVETAIRRLGGLDVLVNNAGVLDFAPLELERPQDIEATFRINVLAPVLLSQYALAAFRRQCGGHIVNVGSIFGSIAFPWFATYSASKFAIRGFSEALRRELEGSGIRVTYVAPRATATPLATIFGRMAQATGMPLDKPELVARRVVLALEQDAKDRYLGRAEPIFVRLNALLPRLVDRALAGKTRQMKPFALEAACRRS
ncbi:MAG TPA: SDR family NAD(P)-dependent oxidoreductase, partial [Planctomycetota bacterium]|nr:SDR family NAD(P)-dependent oxidoreductase [Planctomycetota bacterium]